MTSSALETSPVLLLPANVRILWDLKPAVQLRRRKSRPPARRWRALRYGGGQWKDHRSSEESQTPTVAYDTLVAVPLRHPTLTEITVGEIVEANPVVTSIPAPKLCLKCDWNWWGVSLTRNRQSPKFLSESLLQWSRPRECSFGSCANGGEGAGTGRQLGTVHAQTESTVLKHCFVHGD